MAKTQFATYLWGVAGNACEHLSVLFEALSNYCWGVGTLRDALSVNARRRQMNRILEKFEGRIENIFDEPK